MRLSHAVVHLARALFALVTSVCVLVAAAASARAQGPVIAPGHESAVLSLFAPHALGAEVSGGYALWNVAIEQHRIVVTLRAGDGAETSLTLMHPDVAPSGASRTTSFAIVAAGASDARARGARSALVAAIGQNDDGGFWEIAEEGIVEVGRGARGGSHGPRPLWGQPDWVPIDGIAVIALVYVLGLLLAARLLTDSPRWIGPALFGIVAAGALVRIALSPMVFLGAWPWSRLYPHVRAVSGGSWLDAAADHAGHAFYLTDVMMWTNFAYAVAMPLVLFSHATYLLRDPRAGLAASFAIAFLPQHIRFSRCEDGFIASLVLTTLAFALLHGFLRDRSRTVRWLLALALPFVLYPGYLLRPLNIGFIAVYAVAVLALHRETATRARKAVALALVLGVGAAALVAFLGREQETVEVAASQWGWLRGVVDVLGSPRMLVLSDPLRTPPVVMALSVLGVVLGWRSGERRLVAFLLGWLVLFLVMHAFVVQETMQPRYHLHLVVPFILLAASVVLHLPERLAPFLAAATIMMAVSPWLHRDFIEDLDYGEMHEYALVRRARDLVPEGCTVIEYTGSPHDVDELRFSRIGALAPSHLGQRFRAIGVFPDGTTGPDRPALEEILEGAPSCLYLFEGLACSAFRARDEAYARVCTSLRDRLRAEPVLEARASTRLYDASTARDGLVGRTVPIRLSRANLPPRARAERSGR